jgi:molybdopterin-containing oxidoreductase family membrane subunit
VFWLVVACNTVAPLACFWRRVRRSLAAMVAISILVTIGMWFERFMFIVTTLAHNFDPAAWRTYAPSLRELGVCLGGFGWFVMLFLIFIKVFPSMSVAETMQGHHAATRAPGPAPEGAHA